jgi:hypothetical protein
MDAGCRNARKRLLSCLKAARPHFRHTPSDRRYLSSPHCGRVSPLGTDGAELVESPPFAGRADRRAASIFNEDTLAQGVKFELAAFAVRLFPAPIPVRRRAPWESPRTMSRLRQEARRPNRRDRAASPLARQKATGRLRPPPGERKDAWEVSGSRCRYVTYSVGRAAPSLPNPPREDGWLSPHIRVFGDLARRASRRHICWGCRVISRGRPRVDVLLRISVCVPGVSRRVACGRPEHSPLVRVRPHIDGGASTLATPPASRKVANESRRGTDGSS